MNTNMKTCFIALIISFICMSSYAQAPARKGFIGYSVGPSFHVGNLGYMSSDNEMKQFAKTGYSVSYGNFGYVFKKNLGIAAAVFYGETFVDKSNENDWWVTMGIIAGPMLSYSVQEKLHFDVKLRFGYAGTINYIDSSAGSNDFGDGFAMDFRTAARYDIFKRWCLLLEGGYISMNQKFPDSRKVKIQKIISGIGFAYRLK